jgi:hypothetical protein
MQCAVKNFQVFGGERIATIENLLVVIDSLLFERISL